MDTRTFVLSTHQGHSITWPGYCFLEIWFTWWHSKKMGDYFFNEMKDLYLPKYVPWFSHSYWTYHVTRWSLPIFYVLYKTHISFFLSIFLLWTVSQSLSSLFPRNSEFLLFILNCFPFCSETTCLISRAVHVWFLVPEIKKVWALLFIFSTLPSSSCYLDLQNAWCLVVFLWNAHEIVQSVSKLFY